MFLDGFDLLVYWHVLTSIAYLTLSRTRDWYLMGRILQIQCLKFLKNFVNITPAKFFLCNLFSLFFTKRRRKKLEYAVCVRKHVIAST